nr:MAG TPA: hypothetical protein [Bacteriophage sp.]
MEWKALYKQKQDLNIADKPGIKTRLFFSYNRLACFFIQKFNLHISAEGFRYRTNITQVKRVFRHFVREVLGGYA